MQSFKLNTLLCVVQTNLVPILLVFVNGFVAISSKSNLIHFDLASIVLLP